MAKSPPTFDSLRAQYSRLWASMSIRSTRANGIASQASKIIANKARYEAVSAKTGVPWWFIGVIHSLECGLKFTGHLHNGDSLRARTRQVPAGRPKAGSPPFTWDESACDALMMKGLDKITDWSIERVCYELERYNGWGYRLYHSKTLSPYLWAGTNHYTKGKYVADGKWSASAVSQQSGAVALLKSMEAQGVSLAPTTAPKSSWVPWPKRKPVVIPAADPPKDTPVPVPTPPPALPKEKQKEVIQASRRLTFQERVTNFLEWLGLGGITSFALLDQVRDFLTDWKTLAVLALGVSVWLAFKYSKWLSLREAAEGRYVPSGGAQ